MSITFEVIMTLRLFGLFFGIVLLGACNMQGPWEYTVEEKQEYRGFWVYAHLVADHPVEEVCADRLYQLNESQTRAFHFYDSAHIEISGIWRSATSSSDTSATLVLSPAQRANCFNGPSELLPIQGEEYDLSGLIRWDSSGTLVSSEFTASTEIPERFSITQALAPLPALGIDPATADSLIELILGGSGGIPGLPGGDSLNIDSLLNNPPDSGINIPGFGQLPSDLDGVDWGRFYVPYSDGDELFYLGGQFNTLPHRYVTDYSDDVEGILITHMYDTLSGAKGENPFSNIGNGLFVSDTADYATSGNLDRVVFTPRQVTQNGITIDTLFVFNIYFLEGWNKLYFLAAGSDYQRYVETSIQQEGDSRVEKFYNITGAAGIFAGFAIDSVEFNIDIPDSLNSYPVRPAMAAWCRQGGGSLDDPPDAGRWKDGWLANTSCRNFYLEWCAETDFAESDCASALQFAQRVENQQQSTDTNTYAIESPLDSIYADVSISSLDNADDLSETLSNMSEVNRNFGDQLYCLYHNFPQSGSMGSECSEILDESTGGEEITVQHERLWVWCQDRNWNEEQHPFCRTALEDYVRLNDIDSPVLNDILNR